MPTSANQIELLVRSSRRALITVLAMLLIAGATLLAHAIRPGSLLADWPSRAPWLIPVTIVIFAAIAGSSRRRTGEAITTVLGDELRQASLGRAQRLALIVTLAAQVPLTLLALTSTPTWSAVTIMAVTTVLAAMTTLIVSFLWFDRE